MKKLQLIIPFFFFSILIFSCSKTEVAPKTKTDLLTSNVWKLSKVTEVRSNKSTIMFEIGVTKATTRYDFNKVRITFLKEGTFSNINADNGKENGTWKFTNNESQIEIITATKSKANILYLDKIEEGKLNFSEKDGSDAAQYELIPE
jgi:Domain of unknown function (DUF5004)